MYEDQILGIYTSDESVTTDEKWFVCLSELHSAKVFSLNIFKNFMHFLHKKETFQRYYLDLELEASCPQRPTDFETFISKILFTVKICNFFRSFLGRCPRRFLPQNGP